MIDGAQYFPDENHWILKPDVSFVWHREVFAWLAKYIGRAPAESRGEPGK